MKVRRGMFSKSRGHRLKVSGVAETAFLSMGKKVRLSHGVRAASSQAPYLPAPRVQGEPLARGKCWGTERPPLPGSPCPRAAGTLALIEVWPRYFPAVIFFILPEFQAYRKSTTIAQRISTNHSLRFPKCSHRTTSALPSSFYVYECVCVCVVSPGTLERTLQT